MLTYFPTDLLRNAEVFKNLFLLIEPSKLQGPFCTWWDHKTIIQDNFTRPLEELSSSTAWNSPNICPEVRVTQTLTYSNQLLPKKREKSVTFPFQCIQCIGKVTGGKICSCCMISEYGLCGKIPSNSRNIPTNVKCQPHPCERRNSDIELNIVSVNKENPFYISERPVPESRLPINNENIRISSLAPISWE